MSLPFHPKARREQDAAFEDYELVHPRLAIQFSERIEDALDKIERAPGKYAKAEDARSKHEVRYFTLRRFPFRVVYWCSPRFGPVVIAIAHHRRRPGYWRRRLKDSREHTDDSDD
jgi:hypothetical protein